MKYITQFSFLSGWTASFWWSQIRKSPYLPRQWSLTHPVLKVKRLMNVLKFSFKFRQYLKAVCWQIVLRTSLFSDLLDCFTQWDIQGALNSSTAPCPLDVKAVNNHTTHCDNAEDLKPEHQSCENLTSRTIQKLCLTLYILDTTVMTFIKTGGPVWEMERNEFLAPR